jgi:hypothetical protein
MRTTSQGSVEYSPRVLIQCGDHLENRERILPLAQGLALRGYHPIVLVYSRTFVLPMLYAGVDAIALEDYKDRTYWHSLSSCRWHSCNNSSSAKDRVPHFRKLSRHDYRGLDMEDISYTENLKGKSSRRCLRARVKTCVRQCLRILAVTRPEVLFIWNGYTGLVANTLRVIAASNRLSVFFLERSLFPSGVFVDPLGTNGSSELSSLTHDDIRHLSKDFGAATPPCPY